MSDNCTTCDRCKKNDAEDIREYSEFSHLRSCAISDGKGKVRQSLEPIFKNKKELCYNCRKFIIKKYLEKIMKEDKEKILNSKKAKRK